MKKTTEDNESEIIYDPNTSQIVTLDDKIIGFYNTFIIFDRLTIEYSLFPKYRNQGLGTTFVNIVTELASRENDEYNKLYLLIKPKNEKSIKVALNNNYVESTDIEFNELIREETSEYWIYDRKNEFYKKRVRKYITN